MSCKITDISTPQARKRAVRRLMRKERLRLWWAYARRDTAKIGLKLVEAKWTMLDKRHDRRMAKHEKRIAEIEKSLENEERG